MFDEFLVSRHRVLMLVQGMQALESMSPKGKMVIAEMTARMDAYEGRKIKLNYVVGATAEMCKGRRFFITDTGKYMGIAPDIAEPGDRICVIPGCCAPFVIRPQGMHYQLAGESYVHGIMDGEVMEGSDVHLTEIVLE